MQRLIRCLSLIALAGVLAGSGAGCCCCCSDQGYVIRSSWTLTMHRQPCAGTGDCAAGTCSCADQAASVAARRSGRLRRSGHSTAEAGPLVAGPGHFHPVPTRPVFGPRPELMAVPVSAPAEDSPAPMPDPEDVPLSVEPASAAQQASLRLFRVQPASCTAGCNSCR